MNDIEMKPEVALEILEDKIGKIRDMWFHDALAWGIKALKEKIDGSGNHTDNH